ncbi:acyltransferase [Pseudomonas sp. R4-83]|uniref:acyltransferase family protein n=1 Tax=unclassified Pseudomonas TaxID=196821 RepID=UPI003DA7E5F7
MVASAAKSLGVLQMITKQIKGLTSLRFFAALAILLHHSQGIFIPDGFFNTVPLAGGVGFFFVLSGFILSHAHSKVSGRMELSRFYVSRVARLWPAHVVCALLLLFLIPYQATLLESFKWIVVFLSNLFLIHSMIPIPEYYFSFNSVSWSISTEMFFYALFPLLLMWLPSRPWVKYTAFVAVGLGLSFFLDYFGVTYYAAESQQSLTSHGIIYISPVGRIQEFMLGIICHQLMVGVRDRNIGFKSGSFIEICAVLAVVFLSPIVALWLRPYIGKSSPAVFEFVKHTSLALLFAAVICCFYLEKGMISKALSWRPLVLLGEISFSLYLIHQIIFRLVLEKNLLPDLDQSIRFSIFSGASIVAAYIIWRLVEKPCQKGIMQVYDAVNPRPDRRGVDPA